MSKATIINYENRIDLPLDIPAGIVRYDSDNAYPQRMRLLKAASATASQCIDIRAKYISGQGFEEQNFYASIINSKRWTWDKLLKALAKDYALQYGFAIHFNYNALLEISEINYLPFENVRLGIPDDTGYYSKVKVHSDWARRNKIKRPVFDENTIKTIDVFNPDKEIVAAQILKAGGIEKYKGQVFYYNSESEDYPLSILDSIIPDCETDAEIPHYKNRQVTNSFLVQYVWLNKFRFEKPNQKDDYVENIKRFQGSRNAGKILMLDLENEEEKPELMKVESNVNDKLFAHSEDSTIIRIVRRIGIPPILAGISATGALGDKNDREGAKIIYSEQTEDERILMEAVFAMIFDHWHRPEDNPQKNFAIKPITGTVTGIDAKLLDDMTQNERRVNILKLPPVEEKQSGTKLLSETLGVGGTQSLTSVVIDTTLNKGQKVQILIQLFGFTEEDAKKLIYAEDGN